jgi:hypothetical protein
MAHYTAILEHSNQTMLYFHKTLRYGDNLLFKLKNGGQQIQSLTHKQSKSS